MTLAQLRHLNKKGQAGVHKASTASSMLELQRFVLRSVGMLELDGVHWLVQCIGACGDDFATPVTFHIHAHAGGQARTAEPRAVYPVRFENLAISFLQSVLSLLSLLQM